MGPTGYYGADYMLDIYGADFIVEHIWSWPDTHDSFKGMWNYRCYTVNCSEYKKKKKQRCMHVYIQVHSHVAYMIDICLVIYE